MIEVIEPRKWTSRVADAVWTVEGNIIQTGMGRNGWRSGVIEHGM
jgi:hypothetical protein